MRRKLLLRRIYWISGFLVFFILAFLISVIFLNPSSVGNQNFLWNFNLWAFVWAAIFIVVLILVFVLARNLIHLFFEYQTGQPGSRIKVKLVLTFIIFSLFPALIMFFVAFGLINQNLTKWVSAPSEQLLESSKRISETFYAQIEDSMIESAQEVSTTYPTEFEEQADWIRSIRERKEFSSARLFRVGEENAETFGPVPDELATISDISDAIRDSGHFFRMEKRVNTPGGMVDKGIVAVPVPTAEGDQILILNFELDDSVFFHSARVEEANEVYKGLKGTLASLRVNYFLILSVTTLSVVFAFVWLGSYIARRITVPLEALAEGSRELAGGNLDHRVDVQAVDELGILVGSFNRMAAELKQSRNELEKANLELQKSNVELDQRRRYTETVLQNIATGVLSIDESEVIRTANLAALKMLQTTPEEILSRHIKTVASRGLYAEFREMKKRASLYGSSRKQVTIERNDRQLYVAVTVTASPLPLGEKIEYLIVLDDLTELIRAEKFAVWQEVARRLAHEIKNPLTPIQLSAERITRRFSRIADSLPQTGDLLEYKKILEDSSRMIISESRMLKNLLAEFSKFARLPICKPQPIKLHELIENTLNLYDGTLEAVTIEKEFDPEVNEVYLDPEQMQRVFVNLIDNSLEALVEIREERRITILTSINRSRKSVTVEFQDTGFGIPSNDYEHLFLPYFSTKKRGTGLGLAIVRQIISEHNGFIRAEPNSPRGTRIIIEIPLEHPGVTEV